MKKLLWQQIPHPTVSEILCHHPDFSGVVLDTEHGVFNDETLFNCIQIITRCGKECFVRLTEASLTKTRYCLDAGVDGLIFSTVETHEYCDKILSQCIFPDLSEGYNRGGTRGYGLTRDNFWGENERKKQPLLIPQIETLRGCNLILDDNQEIIDAFDYFFIGPYDLSSSFGSPGDFESVFFTHNIKNVENAIGKEKIGYHIVKDIDKQYQKYKDYGFLAFSMDTIMLIDGYKRIIDNMKLESPS